MSQGTDPIKLQQWSERLERFRNSNQTVAQFCAKEGVSQPSFYEWKKKLSRIDDETGNQTTKNFANKDSAKNRSARRHSKTVQTNSPGFESVQVTPPISIPQNPTIRMPGGIEIELGNDLRVVEKVFQLLMDGKSPQDGVPAC